ncbi:hypothetical protein bpr_IV114 (plasmid) [Butyrivibrio proteoclasticus B316]|uniref:Uncharacterized protein n=2 Tax=Butyrivibrio proteoclasticus TaxID=43305 RepID=E0S4Z7_BUTPB|nr:hypothetical protein bpr_IV114 [Butyrivibrio proteoclasticus B316]
MLRKEISMVIEQYNSVTGIEYTNDLGITTTTYTTVGETKVPDLVNEVLNEVSDCAEDILPIVAIGAACYLLFSEGKTFCDYIGSKLGL